ncbi:DUF4116 domain-containing protein, partial [Clostridioides difficile]
KWVENQTEEICMEAVRQNGLDLKFVKNQTETICLRAVRQNGMALEFVKEQTVGICLKAVRQYGMALKFVKEQTEEICTEAIKQDKRALSFVKGDKEKYKALYDNNEPFAKRYVRNVIEKENRALIKKGEENAKIKIAGKLYDRGMSFEDISDIVEIEISKLKVSLGVF